MRSVPARFLVALAAALPASLALAAPAGAFSITRMTVTPQAPSSGPASGPALPDAGPSAAGAHPDLVTTIDFSDQGDPSADTVRDLALHYAPGIVAYVNHVPRCSLADFDASAQGPADSARCDASTIVGSSTASTTANLLGIGLRLPLAVSGSIYNLEAPAGSPAALGVDIPVLDTGLGLALAAQLKFVIPIGVDPHDLGLSASLSGLPNAVPPSAPQVHTDSLSMTLFGYVGGNSFFTNPTACIPAAVTVSATSYAGADGSRSGSYTPTDCAHEPFSTTLGISVDPPLTDWTSTVVSDVQPGSYDVPRVSSHVRSTTVTLPQSLLLNPALAARLDACTDAQFKQSDTSVAASCPASSAVGDIDFVSPILGDFPGKAYFGSQTPTDRLRLFLDVPLYGAHIKVSAHVHPSYTTGQVTTVFDELPQIAFTDFRLIFHGGPRSALVSPTQCGTHTATAITTPWSGTAPQPSSGGFSVSWDGRGAPCERIFQPSMATSVSTQQAGASPTFTLVANRPDRNVPIGRMTNDLPAGLVGSLTVPGLTQCTLADAAAGRCPASSRVGHVVSVDGSGTEPPSLPGDVFLTKPKHAGDPAGLSVKVPAVLGPVDAGTVIVGARLQLRPDGGLHVVSDPIPPLQLGIPLAIRTLTVTIDRAGFMRNPTSCGEQTATGQFDSIGAEHAGASSKLTFAGCDKLGFRPALRAILNARHRTRANTHPGFVTVIRAHGDDATIRRAHVRLPRALATNTRALNAACSAEDLAADRCSKRARVATAAALSPLIAGPVRGPVYLVKRPAGQTGLPKLVVQLRSPIALSFDGVVNIGKRGGIGTTFPLLPDLPLTKFVLRFHGGRYGALALNRDLCPIRRHLRLPAAFRGANGAVLRARPRIGVRGCRRHRAHRRSHRKRRRR